MSRTSQTKRKLFEATLALVGEHGLAGVTVDDVAARAGVAKGTVYYNFGSKDNLVDALFRYGLGVLADRLRALPESPESVEPLVETMLGFVDEYPSFAQLLVGELWRSQGRWHETLSLLREELGLLVRARLTAAGLPEDVDVRTASAALFGTVLAVALEWKVFQPDRPRRQVLASIMPLVQCPRTD